MWQGKRSLLTLLSLSMKMLLDWARLRVILERQIITFINNHFKLLYGKAREMCFSPELLKITYGEGNGKYFFPKVIQIYYELLPNEPIVLFYKVW